MTRSPWNIVIWAFAAGAAALAVVLPFVATGAAATLPVLLAAQLIDVPLRIGPVYFGLGYLCWRTAGLLVSGPSTYARPGADRGCRRRRRWFTARSPSTPWPSI